MSTIEFEGAVEGIADDQLKFIGEIIQQRGFQNKKVLIEVVGVAGDNYMANVKRFVVPDDDKPFKMIAKIAPNMEMIRMAGNAKYIYQNEHIMYTQVLPKFKNMQIAANIPEKDMLKFAECYGTYMEEPNEIILLEDLKESNFEMLDRFKSLSDECVRCVLKDFAILHSLSYALKHKEPETYDKFRKQLHNVWSNTGPEIQMYFQSVGEQALKMISDNEQRATVLKEAAVGDMASSLMKLLKADADSKHNVIQHGDAWTNNIMFKFKDDQLLESCMIDYQLSREAKPVCDILYLIFNCTDHETRLKHYKDWIDYYHMELDKALSNYDLKANYVYSRDHLDVDLKRYAKCMFAACVVLSAVSTLKSEEAAKVMESMADANAMPQMETIMALDSVAIFKSKIEGLVDSFVEFGLLYAKQ